MTSPSLLDIRKQRWLDFYDLTKSPRHLFHVRYFPGLGPRPWPRPDNIAERIEWAWRKYNLMCDNLAWLDDDSLPYLEVFTGTEIAAAAFDCPVHFPENDMPFAMPIIQEPGQVAGVRVPGLDHPAIAPLFHIADELRRRAGPEALLHMVDLQSPMDTAALIWEKTGFYPAMLEAPEAVHELAGKVQTFLETLLDEWFARYGREFIAHYPDYYMPYGVTCSVDEVGVVSQRMFRQFFTPELEALSSRYGQIGIHCCANARHQWENFKRVPNLRLININQPQREVEDALAFFAQTCVQWPIPQGEGASWTLERANPSGAKTVFEVWVDSKDEAKRMVEKYRRA